MSPLTGSKILDGLDLTVKAGEVAAIMGPNGSGKSTLSYVIAGKPDYEVTAARSCSTARTCLRWRPTSARRKGIFLAFQYPLEIPGVATMTFLKAALNAQRKRARRSGADDARFHAAGPRGAAQTLEDRLRIC